MVKRCVREVRSDGERHAIFTRDSRCVEKNQFVNDSCAESGTVQFRAGFEQDALDIAAAEFGEHGIKIEAFAPRPQMEQINALVLQLTARLAECW
jgi:hypothetical protein